MPGDGQKADICLCSVCCNFIVISLYCIAGGSEQTGCLPYINFSEGEAFGLKNKTKKVAFKGLHFCNKQSAILSAVFKKMEI